MENRINIILDTCIKVFGSDFTKKSRKREVVYARAVFIAIMKDRYLNYSLESIGKVLGGRDHATILHAYVRTNPERDGRYLLEREYREISEAFVNAIDNTIELKDEQEIEVYKNKLLQEVKRLEKENDFLAKQIIKLNKKQPKKDKTFTNEINELPADIKQEFEKYKWEPFKKMLESRKHYNFKINHKPIY